MLLMALSLQVQVTWRSPRKRIDLHLWFMCMTIRSTICDAGLFAETFLQNNGIAPVQEEQFQLIQHNLEFVSLENLAECEKHLLRTDVLMRYRN